MSGAIVSRFASFYAPRASASSCPRSLGDAALAVRNCGLLLQRFDMSDVRRDARQDGALYMSDVPRQMRAETPRFCVRVAAGAYGTARLFPTRATFGEPNRVG